MGFVTDLQKAFDIPLKAFGTANNIQVALMNIDMPTSTGTPFLAGFQLSAPVEQADLTVNELRKGVYQVDINYASHLGAAPINKMYDLLNTAFKVGQDLTFDLVCVNIEAVSPSPITVSNGWATMNMSIDWSGYTARL